MKGPEYNIVNSVVSTRIQGPFNMEKLALSIPGTEYEPEVFPALITRWLNPKATLILFSTGRFVSNSPSVTTAMDAISAVAKEISAIEGRPLELEKPKVVNIVATSDFKTVIDLEEFVSGNENCLYEPEQFPGAICRLKNSVVVLVFGTGKVVCVGAKSEEDFRMAFGWLEENLGT